MLGFTKVANRRSIGSTRKLAPMARVLHASALIAAALSHSRIPFRNLSGRTCTMLEVLYTNWGYNASSELGATSSVTIRAAIEYPAGVITPLTTDGTTRDISLSSSQFVGEALKASGLNIPSGAIFWIRTRAIVSGGDGLMAAAYTNTASFEGGTIQAWTGSNDGSDFTLTGNQPTSVGAAFGPAAVCSRELENPQTSFAIIGDSIARGSSSGFVSYAEIAAQARGGMYLNVAFPSARINHNDNRTMPRRRALLKAANCLDCIIGFPMNDFTGSFSNSSIQSSFISFWTTLKADGFRRIIQCTCSPKTVTDINTPDPSPAGVFTGGTNSARAQHNAWLRTQVGLANRPDMLYEFADILESARDTGVWRNSLVTTDFLHPNIFGSSFAGDDMGNFLQSAGYRRTIQFPSFIPDLRLWLDASDLSSITQSGGGVSQWNDKSGNNLHATQVTTGLRPITGVRTLNKLNTLDFDGIDDRLLLNAGINDLMQGSNSAFVVYMTDNTTTGRRLLNGIGSGSNYILSQDNAQINFVHRTDFTGTASVLATSSNTPNVAIGIRSGTSCRAGRNGILGTVLSTAQNVSLSQLWIGGAGASEMMDGQIAEIIIYQRALNTTEINQVGRYLANKWGFLWHAS
jgi:hypothetical protein